MKCLEFLHENVKFFSLFREIFGFNHSVFREPCVCNVTFRLLTLQAQLKVWLDTILRDIDFLKKDDLNWGLVVPPDVLGVKAVALG